MKGLKRVWLKSVTRAAALSAMIAAAVAPCTASAVTLDKLSGWQPALAVFNGKLFLAYTGTDGQLNVASSTDGLTFGNSVIISNNSSAVGPGLAAYGGNLYIAWAGTDGKRKINYMSSTDGVTWSNKTLFGSEASYGNPALAGSSNQLLIAWNGTDSAHTINVGCIVCTGSSYGTKQTYSPGSDYGVGLAAINDNFFLAVKRSGSATILSSSAANPLTFNLQTSAGSSLVGPAIAGSGGFAYVGWVDSSSYSNLYLGQFSVYGTSISPQYQWQRPENERSLDNPAVAVFNGHVYYAWSGTDDHLNIAQVQ